MNSEEKIVTPAGVPPVTKYPVTHILELEPHEDRCTVPMAIRGNEMVAMIPRKDFKMIGSTKSHYIFVNTSSQ